MLELARVLSAEPHRNTLIFMASDSHAYGPAWGAKAFAERFQGRIVAALDLGYAEGDASRLVIEGAGLRSGYAPLWLRAAGLAAVETGGAAAAEAQGLAEYYLRALPLAFDDSGTYLRARVPAIGLSSRPDSASAGPASAVGMAAYGQAAEAWLRSVDALNPVPRESVAVPYLRLSRAQHLPSWAVSSLQLLLFAPLFLATAAAWRMDRPTTDELKPELYALLGIVVAGLDGYAVAYALAVAGVLPRYDMLPGSPGDPFLLQPNWLAALAIFGTVAFFGWYTFRRGGWGYFADRLEIPYRRTTLLLILSATVFFFWQINGFAVSAFLGLPAYLWIWIEPRRPVWGKGLNVALALAGTLPFVLGVLNLTRAAQVGPAWWFVTLSAAYGLLPLPAVAAVVIGLALFVRFLRHGLRQPRS